MSKRPKKKKRTKRPKLKTFYVTHKNLRGKIKTTRVRAKGRVDLFGKRLAKRRIFGTVLRVEEK